MGLRQTAAELGLTPDLLKVGLELLSKNRTIMRKGERVPCGPAVTIENGRVARSTMYRAERSIAEDLERLFNAPCKTLALPADLWSDFDPHADQVLGIEAIACRNVAVLTGGPGTGKSALTRKALEVYHAAGLSVLQVAPTGKAARRMAELTNFPARTIHRALGVDPGRGGGWLHHAGNTWPVGVVIVDEVSMVDVQLCAALLDAIKTGARLLFIGDVDQLPSVDAGRVLYDVIQSGTVPIVRLTKIFRQASESRIPYVAKDINEGRLPSNLAGEGTDVRFVERDTEEACVDLVVKAITVGIPQQKGIATRDIQVIVPQKNREIGVEALNIALQTALNPATDNEMDVPIGVNYLARAKDRVLHVKNNYDLAVMNGEMGVVLDSNPDGVDLAAFPAVRTSEDPSDDEDDEDVLDDVEGYGYASEYDNNGEGDRPRPKTIRRQKYLLVVEYDDGAKLVAYNKAEVRELHLGYACTVHKFQGSQSPAVIFIAHSAHSYTLTRANVYTALTRAQKYCLIIGQTHALARAAGNTRGAERRTQLRDFLTLSRTVS